jgi:CBS domain-containing protein
LDFFERLPEAIQGSLLNRRGQGLTVVRETSERRRSVMKTVKDILRTKGHDVWTIPPDATVYEALSLMADKNVGALVVLDGETVVGIMSERDYARKVVLHGKLSKEIPVKEIMTARVYYVRPEQNIQECMAQMTDKRVRHLPVLENDRLIGIISIGDVVKAIIAEQEFLIRYLESYITGTC